MKTINYLFATIITILLSTQILSAQEAVDTKNIWRDAVGQNFFEVQRQMEEYYTTHSTGKGSGYKQWKRWESFMQDRILPGGTIPNLSERIMKEYKKQQSQLNESRSLIGNWKNLGPTNFTPGPQGYAPGLGRINCIAFDPTDPNTIYVGAPAGGLWKTTDGGVNWQPLAQELAQLGVSGIVVKSSTDIYILTGDGDGGQNLSIGVYKSTDGGLTWTNTTLPWAAGTNVRGYKLSHRPAISGELIATTDQGIYLSNDNGTSWFQWLSCNCRDFEVSPANPNNFYASSDNDVYKYAGGWSTIQSNIPNVNRIALAVTADEPNAVYQVRGPGYNAGTGSDPDYRFRGLFKSTDQGNTYTSMSTSPNIFGADVNGLDSLSQSAYDMAMIANPDDGGEILVGGVNLWGSPNNGVSWTNKAHWVRGPWPDPTYVHADIHALEQNPLDGKLYCGSDGGIYMSEDFGDTWVDLSATLSVSMFYRIDGIETDPNKIIMGAQDNGTLIMEGEDHVFTNIDGADGMDCQIDPTDPNTLYYSYQNGSLLRSTNNGNSRISIKPGSSDGIWTTPVQMDYLNTDRLVTGYRDTVYISDNQGDSWDAYTPYGIEEEFVRRIYTDPTNGDIYISRFLRIYRSPENVSSNSWTDITYNLPTQPGVNITSIAVTSVGTTYVTLSGFIAANKVFYLPVGSTTWQNVTHSGLPNTPITCIDWVYNDEVGAREYYVGTDVGIYRRQAASTNWTLFSNGLVNQSTPNVPIMDLQINESDGLIYAATFGRGLWVSGLYGTCADSEFLTQVNDTDEGNPGMQYIKAGRYIEGSRIVEGVASNHVIYQAGEKQVMKPGFHVKKNSYFKATINTCDYIDPDS